MCIWISLTSLLVLGGMLFAFGSACTASHWVWYTFSTCLWAILPSRQMAVFWCCKKDPDLLKTQVYSHTIGTHFCMSLLTYCQVADFTRLNLFWASALEVAVKLFKKVTVAVLWKWYFELYFMREECFQPPNEFMLSCPGLIELKLSSCTPWTHMSDTCDTNLTSNTR